MEGLGERDTSRRDRARALRRAATAAEKELWWHLRRKLALEDTHFRRQVAIGPYFADFACLKHRLVIELDGGQHTLDEEARRDAVRTVELERQGFRVLRFWNNQVFTEIESVLETIFVALQATRERRGSPPPPTPPHKGEGRRERPGYET